MKKKYGYLFTWVDEETGQPEMAFNIAKPMDETEYMFMWENIACDKGVRNFVRRFVRAIEEHHGIK